MKRSLMSQVLPGVALLCLFTSCGSHESAYYTADSVAYAYDPGTTVPDEKLMVRSAQMNFQVKELQKTSQKISSLTAHYGGEVWNSHLKTEIQNTITKKVSADSLLKVITHRQTNELTIRVPSKNLDSLLISLEGLSILLHEKDVNTENVTLQYLSNELKSKNIARSQERQEDAIDSKKSSIDKFITAENNNLETQNEVVDRQIRNMEMLDKVNYSTVTLSIYQDTEASKQIVADLDPDRFGPGFCASSLMALQDGWEFVLGVFIFLIRLWPLYFFSIGIFYLVLRMKVFSGLKSN